MAESRPINWALPFPSKEPNSNPLQLLTHMANAKGGHYPTGENGLWHGGVHFDEGTAAFFDQSSVRCMADGEVIAYRIEERYSVSEFTDEIPRIKRAPFSTGFVLVKHKLQPPPLRNADGTITEGQTPPSLNLYSLYMHLLDWAGYQAQPDLQRPSFWVAKRYTVNTENGGLSVRAGPSKNATRLSQLPKGAEITIGTAEGEFSKLVNIVSGTAHPALAADDEGQLPGYVFTSLLKPLSEPVEYGKVVVLENGWPIKAGDLIGHPGLYQNHDSAAQHMVHVELFSCDDVPAFIAQSRAWASRLPDDQKTLLRVYKGASKLIAHRDDINGENPPKLDDDGTQIGVDLIIPQSLMDGLPASRKIQVKDGTDNTMYWWRLDGLFADANGNPIDGWLAEQQLITTRHSPWEWEGFQCIEETGTPVEKLAYAFNARGLLSAEQQQNYRAQINKADGGPILTLARLHDIIDTDKTGKLSSREIRAALAKPWQAQLLGQLGTRYESEWFWEKSKWDELDPLLEEEPGTPNLIWQTEKQRIEKLSWWRDLADKHGIGRDGKAWHINALGLSSGFSSPKTEEITVPFLEKMLSKPGAWFTGRGGSQRFITMFRESYPAIYDFDKKEFVNLLNVALIRHGIITGYQKAHFLAQCFHESAHFETTIEFASGEGYNPGRHRDAEANGNTTFGDGPKYKGKGLLQLTWKKNYVNYSKDRGIDFISAPDLIASDMYNAIDASCWFWRNNGCVHKKHNARGDINILIEHEKDNVGIVTLAVNGGDNGLAERKEIFEAIKKEWRLE